MLKITRLASRGALVALGVGAYVLGISGAAYADACTSGGCLPTSDRAAAILVWPKIVVDTVGVFGPPTDTVIQMSNSASTDTAAQCFLVNANSHCAPPADTSKVCQTSLDCAAGTVFAACLEGWNEIDFDVVLTANQPLGWYASSGLIRADLPLRGNIGTGVPPVPEDPFVGSLTCIQVKSGPSPSVDVSSNSLKGEASIESVLPGAIPNTEKYNAAGILGTGTSPTVPGALQLGGTGASYGPCPTTLILNHTFDVQGTCSAAATNPRAACSTDADCPGGTCIGPPPDTRETTDLTLVPCGNDFLRQLCGQVTAQFVVFNEFEQRFSTSRSVDCFLESQMSKIDTNDPTRSIFSIRVSQTAVGQTRIRGVGTASTGRGLLGVVRRTEVVSDRGAAYNLFESGVPDFTLVNPDVIVIP